MAVKLKRILMTSGDFSAEELGDKIKEYGIVAPNTKNLLRMLFSSLDVQNNNRRLLCTFYIRPSEVRDEQLNVFHFPPLVSLIKCIVLPVVQNQEYEDVAKVLSKSLTVKRISNSSNWIDIAGTSIGERYARANELGVPLAITVDSISSMTIQERDSKDQIQVKIDKAASVVNAVTYGHRTWEDIRLSHSSESS
ncbi:hypothetical protein LWI29_024752 [Acer saccharum]|uniref:Anticodon-binding domain-containing protein n=1 Tax=Acer saccharum TaxID=4024 RepID=A0AA39SP19_ACESA|nr:hypothetical protein LWI29_031076 [Acer saccharum]KAK0594116.1 hypothetical protein LWI29_024752 [Acer saccharum]